MTRRETIEYLRKKEAEGNEQAITVMDVVCLYVPRILDYPEAATREDVERYNSLVRANVYDKYLLENLIIQR